MCSVINRTLDFEKEDKQWQLTNSWSAYLLLVLHTYFVAKGQMHKLLERAMELRKKKNVKEGYELLIDHILKVNKLNKISLYVVYLVTYW